MNLSLEARSVLSDLLVELAVVALVSIPVYFIGQDWLRLTLAVFFSILTYGRRFIYAKEPMTSLNEFFNSTQVITALTIIAIALYFLAFERKAHKK